MGLPPLAVNTAGLQDVRATLTTPWPASSPDSETVRARPGNVAGAWQAHRDREAPNREGGQPETG